MPIEVLKPGRNNWEKRFHAVCVHCECEFKCTQDDGEYQVNVHGDEIVKVKCPHCMNECVARVIPHTLRDIYN